jgi:hypothetical protein
VDRWPFNDITRLIVLLGKHKNECKTAANVREEHFLQFFCFTEKTFEKDDENEYDWNYLRRGQRAAALFRYAAV